MPSVQHALNIEIFFLKKKTQGNLIINNCQDYKICTCYVGASGTGTALALVEFTHARIKQHSEERLSRPLPRKRKKRKLEGLIVEANSTS